MEPTEPTNGQHAPLVLRCPLCRKIISGIGIEGRAVPELPGQEVIAFYCPEPRCKAVLGVQMRPLPRIIETPRPRSILSPGGGL